MKNLDEILENITKTQNPTRILHDLATPEAPTAATSGHKNSDMLYLTIGIISGVLLILVVILIVMCLLRIFQRKKFLGKNLYRSSIEIILTSYLSTHEICQWIRILL